MKKQVILLLMPFLLGCKSQSNSGAQFKHVVIFGVDGAGGEFENIDTPNFDRIFGSGSINYHGVAQSPTISARNWGSMIYGVSASTHKKTNSYIASNKHTDENLPSFIKSPGAHTFNFAFSSRPCSRSFPSIKPIVSFVL